MGPMSELRNGRSCQKGFGGPVSLFRPHRGEVLLFWSLAFRYLKDFTPPGEPIRNVKLASFKEARSL